MWRTLEYATTKEECTLESKGCLESVVAPTPAQGSSPERGKGHMHLDFAYKLISLNLLVFLAITMNDL